MCLNILSAAIESFPPETLSDNDGEALVILFLGEKITLAFTTVIDTIAGTVARAPAGSTADFGDGAPTPEGEITPDIAGYYKLTAANGANSSRTVHVVVWPLATKTHFRLTQPNRLVHPMFTTADPAPRSEAEVRDILKKYALNKLQTGYAMSGFDAVLAASDAPDDVVLFSSRSSSGARQR